ncbi:MAG: GyrI-like domain-containing protein [Chloroflexota bacterium]|nr:GyrI-like domain-containing protein [Chloroflexota bacterium]MDE2895005.1 GyrI-like domain-containing protein [Chloroflexota bacterium]
MPEIVQLEARRAAVMQAEASTEELPATFARIFPAVYAALTEQGVSDMGHVIAVYHTMDANQMTLSAGIEIGDGVEPPGEIELLELPACDAVKADHFGPYEELGRTHEQVWQYVEEIGRAPAGGPIERYITDPEAEPDTSKWHTEILLPLQ